MGQLWYTASTDNLLRAVPEQGHGPGKTTRHLGSEPVHAESVTHHSSLTTTPLPTFFRRLLATTPDPAVLLIRLSVGAVFLSEGLQKFLFPAELGAGRFAKIGLPAPAFFGPFVGAFEISCGLLVLLGLFTRLAAVSLLTIMLVAIASTKVALLADKGFWGMLHDSRTDWAMLLGSLFLLMKGGGKWSADERLTSERA